MFVEWNKDTETYSTTPLGRAAFGSSLTPEESLIVFEDDLAKAREGFVLASDLHLVYQVTPIHVELEPDWSLFYQKFVELSHLEQTVGNRVGVMEPFLMRMAHGAPVQLDPVGSNFFQFLYLLQSIYCRCTCESTYTIPATATATTGPCAHSRDSRKGGSKIRLVFDKTSVKPLGTFAQLPPFDVPKLPEFLRPRNNCGAETGEFETTYLDNDFRISRGDRGELRIFVKV
ncbi:hypothetical protein R1sor_025767 [Riccia sorocarpa]|uniref:Uncharacterized protein n=1 Tax=Riccia sorocarpa TaxID=122646 RepID=A0ABD3GDG4_9MARC